MTQAPSIGHVGCTTDDGMTCRDIEKIIERLPALCPTDRGCELARALALELLSAYIARNTLERTREGLI